MPFLRNLEARAQSEYQSLAGVQRRGGERSKKVIYLPKLQQPSSLISDESYAFSIYLHTAVVAENSSVSILWYIMHDQQDGAALPALPFSKLKDGALLQCLATLRSNNSLDVDLVRGPGYDPADYPRPRYTRARE